MTFISHSEEKTDIKIHKFNPCQIKSQIPQLSNPLPEEPSNTTPLNQTNSYDINIQRQELNKGIHTEETLNGKLNIQQKSNTSWLVTTIKAIMKTPIQKLENYIFLFKRTNKAVVRNSKILTAFSGDLGAAIETQKCSSLNYGSEFRDTADLSELFHYHEDKINIINIIQ